MGFHFFPNVAHFAVGGDGQGALRGFHADQIVLALFGHQAGALDSVLQLLALDGHAGLPGGGQDLLVVDVFAGQQAGHDGGVADDGHHMGIVQMEGGHFFGVFHDMGQFGHDPAGDDRLDLFLIVRQHEVAVVALQGQTEAVQTHQMQLGAADLHQTAGQGLTAFLHGDGKGHFGDHVLQLALGEVKGEGAGQILHLGEFVGRYAGDGGAALAAADGHGHFFVHGKGNGALGQFADDLRQKTAGQDDLTGLGHGGGYLGLDAQGAVGTLQQHAVLIAGEQHAFQNLHGRAGAQSPGGVLQAVEQILGGTFKLHFGTSDPIRCSSNKFQ